MEFSSPNVRKIVCAFLGAILALALFPVTSFAEVTQDIAVEKDSNHNPTASAVSEVSKIDSAHLSAVVLTAIDTPFNETLKFSFESVSCNGVAASSHDCDMPSLSDYSLPVSNLSGYFNKYTSVTSAAYEYQIPLSKIVMPGKTLPFTHEGEYVYRVYQSSSAVDNWYYSGAEYTLRIYVVTGSDGSCEIQGATVNKNITDSSVVNDNDNYVYENGVGKGVDAKVDPTVDAIEESEYGKMHGFSFRFVYIPLQSLQVKLDVQGPYANRSLAWRMSSLEITIPEYAQEFFTDSKLHAVIKQDASTEKLESSAAVNATYTFSNFDMFVDDSVEFSDAYNSLSSKLPVGSMYSIQQKGYTGYTNAYSALLETSSGEKTFASAGVDKGMDYTVSYGESDDVSSLQNIVSSKNYVGDADGNMCTITNTLDTVPTLASTGDAQWSFVLMICVVAMVGLIAIRHKNLRAKK